PRAARWSVHRRPSRSSSSEPDMQYHLLQSRVSSILPDTGGRPKRTLPCARPARFRGLVRDVLMAAARSRKPPMRGLVLALSCFLVVAASTAHAVTLVTSSTLATSQTWGPSGSPADNEYR